MYVPPSPLNTETGRMAWWRAKGLFYLHHRRQAEMGVRQDAETVNAIYLWIIEEAGRDKTFLDLTVDEVYKRWDEAIRKAEREVLAENRREIEEDKLLRR